MLTVLIGVVLAPGLYRPAENPASKIRHLSFDLDGLPLRVTWPEGAKGSLPVFVFSHGMYGSRTGYGPLVDMVAGNGYAVIQPSHADSITRLSAAERQALLRNPNTNQIQNWNERPGEISKCIDKLTEIGGKAGVTLDPSRLAVGGHSFGAWTTQALAGMELTSPGRKLSFYEPRAKAFVVLSGTGPGGAVQPEGLRKMHGPMLFVTGTNDKGRTGDTGEWRRKAYDLSPAGDRWLVWIDEATHNFGGLTGERTEVVRAFLRKAGSSANDNPQHTALAKSAVMAFLDAYVKGERKAKAYLVNKEIEKAGGVSVSAK